MIYLLRHGQTSFNSEGRFGGNPSINNCGRKVAAELANFFKGKDIKKIYCSALKRSIQTAYILTRSIGTTNIFVHNELNEIDSGALNSKTFKEFEIQYNTEFLKRRANKYYWEFPNGESYETAWKRLEKFILWILQNEDKIIIVGHKGVNRLIVGHIANIEKAKIPYINIPQNKIIEIDIERYRYKQINLHGVDENLTFSPV